MPVMNEAVMRILNKHFKNAAIIELMYVGLQGPAGAVDDRRGRLQGEGGANGQEGRNGPGGVSELASIPE
eukprot:1397658-Prymnesium_polylepis.1